MRSGSRSSSNMVCSGPAASPHRRFANCGTSPGIAPPSRTGSTRSSKLGGSTARGAAPAGCGRPGGADRSRAAARRAARLGSPPPAAVGGPARGECHRTAQRRGDGRADAVRVPRALPDQSHRWRAIARTFCHTSPRVELTALELHDRAMRQSFLALRGHRMYIDRGRGHESPGNNWPWARES